MSDIKKELRNARRRVSRARNFPVNTTPASRHLELMAQVLASGNQYHSDPKHSALSIYYVLESFYKSTTNAQEGV